jgi:hypothetical protein
MGFRLFLKPGKSGEDRIVNRYLLTYIHVYTTGFQGDIYHDDPVWQYGQIHTPCIAFHRYSHQSDS